MSLFLASRQTSRVLSRFYSTGPTYQAFRRTPTVPRDKTLPWHKRDHVALPERYWRPELTPDKQSDPLRILFCGSDEFSCASLKAVYDEHVENKDLIERIDVVVRPGKPTGRGRKEIREPLLKGLATELGLNIFERDTFTGWNMPDGINLIIAVSFGLFVPPRLLQAAKYGGLNLHPSLLPDLRGPAPLHHTLLQGRKVAGVTLQTLDDKAYDHGVILDQTHPDHRLDAGAVRIFDECRTVPQLQSLMTPVAASMLVRGLRQGLHVPPHEDRRWQKTNQTSEDDKPLIHAPKIKKEDSQLTRSLLQNLHEENASLRNRAKKNSSNTYPTVSNKGLLSRYQDAIGPLWFYARTNESGRKRQKRILITSLTEIPFKREYPRPTRWDEPQDERCKSPFGVKDTDVDKTHANYTQLRGYAVQIQEHQLAHEPRNKQREIRQVKMREQGEEAWADAGPDDTSGVKVLSEEGQVPSSEEEKHSSSEPTPPSESESPSPTQPPSTETPSAQPIEPLSPVESPVESPPMESSPSPSPPLETSETPLVGDGTNSNDTTLILWNSPRTNTLHLSNYVINSVKVEGRSEQPAWEGLREFIKEWKHIYIHPPESRRVSFKESTKDAQKAQRRKDEYGVAKWPGYT
ncbi:hypothetical protein GGR57DRAFT_478146 [Xylariaceae sp. FL1272]|nr:hypothetical protein GGR57DRAFT_478146 [Xylariaceae sp. FL1272]